MTHYRNNGFNVAWAVRVVAALKPGTPDTLAPRRSNFDRLISIMTRISLLAFGALLMFVLRRIEAEDFLPLP